MTIGGSMINFTRQSIAAALRAEMHRYALMADISEDGMAGAFVSDLWGCQSKITKIHVLFG